MMGFGLIWTALVVGGIAYALGWRPGNLDEPTSRNQRSSVDILQERYARGEISKAEYDTIRSDLLN